MKDSEIMETLEKQLKLLSERSAESNLGAEDLHHLTSAMVEAANVLLTP